MEGAQSEDINKQFNEVIMDIIYEILDHITVCYL